MKVAFVVIAVFLALVVYVSAQEIASNQFLRKYKNIRKKIRIVAKLQNVPNTMKSWKDRKSCYPDDLAMLPQRLLDWFHVLKNIDLRQGDIAYDQEFTQTISQNVGCSSPALVWFFKKFDVNKDLVLNKNELAEIESIPYEHCIKQFFQRCDVNNDLQLSLDETCHCFAEPPCSKVLKEIRAYKKKNGESPIRMYEPQCDEDGFYMPRQCNVYGCRCVDRFNQAIEGTNAVKPGDCPDNTDPNEVLFTGDEEDEE